MTPATTVGFAVLIVPLVVLAMWATRRAILAEVKAARALEDLAAMKAHLQVALAKLASTESELTRTTQQLKIEQDVATRLSRLGVEHARRVAYLTEALRTVVSQRRRWIRIGNQFAHEVSELKGKAATTETLLGILERILGR